MEHNGFSWIPTPHLGQICSSLGDDVIPFIDETNSLIDLIYRLTLINKMYVRGGEGVGGRSSCITVRWVMTYVEGHAMHLSSRPMFSGEPRRKALILPKAPRGFSSISQLLACYMPWRKWPISIR